MFPDDWPMLQPTTGADVDAGAAESTGAVASKGAAESSGAAKSTVAASPAGAAAPTGAATAKHWKPIMDAAFAGDAIAARRLLSQGADPNVVSKTAHRYRPLHRAIELKKMLRRGPQHDAVVKILLEAGADPTLRAGRKGNGLTALQLSAVGETRFVPLLKKYFQPLDIFHSAVLGDEKRVGDLLQKDGRLATATDVNGWPPLFYCAASAMFKQSQAAAVTQARIAQRLVDAGAEPNWALGDSAEWPLPVLYFCCGMHDNPVVAEVLLKAGANPCDNESVYHAADENHTHCLALFEKYCDRNALAKECTKCLSTQMHYGRVRGAPWLLAHGADPNDFHGRGESALHSAVRNSSNDETIRLLLNHGARPELNNAQGHSAAALAKELGRARIFKLLQSSEKGAAR
jgi:ankyrin repeat protein